MADVYEQNLAQKSTLTTSDFIRVVGSDNVSYKQLVSDVADMVLQAYPTTIAVADIQAWAQAHNGVGITQTNPSSANLPSGVSNLYGVAWCNNYVYSSNIWCNLFWSPTNSNDIYQCRKLNSGAWTAWEKMPTRAEIDALNNKLTLNTLAQKLVVDANNNQGDSVNFQIYTGTSTRYKINFGRNGSLSLQYYDGSSWSTIWTK